MPALNIGGGDNGLKAAIEALTQAVNRLGNGIGAGGGANAGGAGAGGAAPAGGAGGTGGAGGAAAGGGRRKSPFGDWRLDPATLIRIRSMQQERVEQKKQDTWLIQNQNTVWKAQQKKLQEAAQEKARIAREAERKSGTEKAKPPSPFGDWRLDPQTQVRIRSMQRERAELKKQEVQLAQDQQKNLLGNWGFDPAATTMRIRSMQQWRAEQKKQDAQLAQEENKRLKEEARTKVQIGKEAERNNPLGDWRPDPNTQIRIRSMQRLRAEQKKQDDGLAQEQRKKVDEEAKVKFRAEKEAERKRVQLVNAADKQIKKDQDALARQVATQERRNATTIDRFNRNFMVWQGKGAPLYNPSTGKRDYLLGPPSPSPSPSPGGNTPAGRGQRDMFDRQPRTMLGSGLSMLGLTNPYVAAIEIGLEAVKMLHNSPDWAVGKANMMMGASKPYTDPRLGVGALGMKGNFDGLGFLDMIAPGTFGTSDFEHPETPAWMQALRLSPMDSINALRDYGISAGSPENQRSVVQSLGKARFMPYLGGGELADYAGMGQLGGTLGITGTNPADQTQNLDRFFARYQTATVAAFSMGLDGAQSIKSIENLLKQNAATAASNVSQDRSIEFWAKMASTGMPEMRTGQGQLNFAQGENQSLMGAGFGGNPISNVIMQRMFNLKLGGRLPTTVDDLKQLVPANIIDEKLNDKTGFGRSQIDNILDAGKRGMAPVVQSYMAALVAGNNGQWAEWAIQSGIPAFSDPVLGPLALSEQFHIPIGEAQNYYYQRNHADNLLTPDAADSARYGVPLLANTGSIDKQMAGLNPDVVPGLKAGASWIHMPPAVMGALADVESSGGKNIGPGGGSKSPDAANGVTQIKPSTYADMRRDHPEANLGPYDPKNHRDIAVASAFYLQDMMGLLKGTSGEGNLVKGYELYNMGPGHLQDVLSGNVSDRVKNDAWKFQQSLQSRADPNTFDEYNRVYSKVEGAGVYVGQKNWNEVNLLAGQPGDILVAFTREADLATAQLHKFAEAVGNAMRSMVDHLPGHPNEPPPGRGNGYTEQYFGGSTVRVPRP